MELYFYITLYLLCSHVCNGSTFEEMGRWTSGGLFSFSHVSLWKEVRPLALVVSTFACWVFSLALVCFIIPLHSLSLVFLMRLIGSVLPNCIFLFLIIFYVLSAFYITLFRGMCVQTYGLRICLFFLPLSPSNSISDYLVSLTSQVTEGQFFGVL